MSGGLTWRPEESFARKGYSYQKLGANDRTAAVAEAMRRRLIE